MKVVIVGDGKVGFTLTKELSQAGHEVVVIDNDQQVLQESQDVLDVMVVHGNGASLDVQREANVGSANLLIAATSSDEVNLLCCACARKLGCKHTIARVRNPEYEQQARFLREELGLSMVINPEKAAAREIFRVLQLPSFLKRESFARGRVELVEMKIKEGSPLCGLRLDHLGEVSKVKMLLCAVEREGRVIIPKGNFVLQEGDKISVTAPTSQLSTIIKDLGIHKQRIQYVMIMGGSRIAEYLAQMLIEARVRVKIIEKDLARCRQLAEALPEALIIHGDGTAQDLLLSEDIQITDALVTLSGLDEENLIVSMYADFLGVPKCITKLNRTEYASTFEDKGLDTIVSPKLITANAIIRYVRAMSNTSGGSLITLHRLVDEKAEALEFAVTARSWYREKPLYELKLKDNLLIACIIRGGQIIIPKGGDCLKLGDVVVIVADADRAITDLNEIFRNEPEKAGKNE